MHIPPNKSGTASSGVCIYVSGITKSTCQNTALYSGYCVSISPPVRDLPAEGLGRSLYTATQLLVGQSVQEGLHRISLFSSRRTVRWRVPNPTAALPRP